MISLFKGNQENEGTFMGIIRSDSDNAIFNKISIYTNACEDYQIEKEKLLDASNTLDEFEKSSIQRALNILEKNPPPENSSIAFNSSVSSNGFYFFYQLQDSQPYFLHPLNVSMLKRQLGEYELFPTHLRGKIIEIERIHITEHEQKRYG